MTRIFLTGASGYIGGDVLHLLSTTHPEYECRALMRDASKATTLTQAYPDVRIVSGDLDSSSLLEEEASQADIVIHAASSSHIKSVEAIARGLAKRAGSKPGYWIQISGASVVSISDIVNGRFGEASDKVFSDVDGADEVREIIHQNSSRRVVDDFILNLTGPKTALIFPPIIYGQGRGIQQRSIQIPELARVAIQNRVAVQVGKGESTWSSSYIGDVSDVFLKLVENAVKGEDGNGKMWNKEGLYFVGSGRLTFGKISQLIAEAAYSLGLTDSTTVQSLSPSEANALSGHASALWGTNAQLHSQRASQVLGWTPRGHSLQQEIPTTVKEEANRVLGGR